MKRYLIAPVALLFGALVDAQETTVPQRSEVSGDYLTPTEFIVDKGASGILWSYTTSAPSSGWHRPDTSISDWESGYGGFYDGSGFGATDEATTPFDGTIWLRGHVQLTSDDVDQFMLWGRWDEQIEIYINGTLAATRRNWAGEYQYIPINLGARDALVVGQNLVAVRVTNVGDPGFFDLGVARFPVPTTGYTKNPAFKSISNSIRSRVKRGLAPATAVAVARENASNGEVEILFSSGYGYMDKAFTRPVQQDAIFRLASTDKSITFAALIKMITGQIDRNSRDCDSSRNLDNPDAVSNPANPSEKLNCSSLVYPIMQEQGLVPGGTSIVDSELQDITISHLLNFQDNLSGRPDQATRQEVWDEYYTPLGIQPHETTPETLMEYYFTTPTRAGSAPGDASYNSNGAAVARYIIDIASPHGILDYIRNTLFEDSPVKDIYVAHERMSGRVLDVNGQLREPWYRTLREPWDFWVGLEDALALASSTETLVMGFPDFPIDQGIHWGRGAMPGTHSAIDQNQLSGSEDTIYVAWLQSGITPNFDADFAWLRNALTSLPSQAWDSVTGRITHTQSGYCIHPSGGSSNPLNGTRAVIWNSCSDEPRLNFAFSTHFGLEQTSSGKCLHPEGGASNPSNGTRIVYHDGCDEPRVDFKVMLSGELKHIPSGKCVKPVGAYNGAELYLTTCSSNDESFRFQFGDVAF